VPSLEYLDTIPIERVSGLSGARGKALSEARIRSVRDLLFHFPRRYIDRSRVEPVAQLPVGEEVTVIAEVLSVSTRRPRARLTMTEARLTDGTGTIKAVWFNQAFRARQLTVGAEVALSGKVERFKGTTQMKSPDVDVLSSSSTEGLKTGRVVPIHPNAAKVGSGWIRRGIWNALKRARPIEDPVPTEIVARRKLASRNDAFYSIHFPDSMKDVAIARRRLIFDEFFRLETALALNKRLREENQVGIVHGPSRELSERFVSGLPYVLTGAQRKAIEEVVGDMATSYPMQRLIQGEVGSGKTVVAVAALLVAVESGYQTAVMAPTEVLAVQHFLGISDLFDQSHMTPPDMGPDATLGMDSLFSEEPDEPTVRLALLTGSQAMTNFDSGAGRSEILEMLAKGDIDIIVGTHALIQDAVEFASLGMAVIDEQHRFGAEQRNVLRQKGDSETTPDLLIMTATPIPRTLSMTLYGDLEETIIDELPPGRSPIQTRAVGRDQEKRVWELVSEAVSKGRQAFVVCPLVEDSEKIEAASAESEFRRLSELLPDLRFGLIHGQMPPRDKDAIMHVFRSGELDVLVATTVIEVGIDIPNATVMVIEDADRFGLSQLHQLRGRVGRGEHPGVCILLADSTTPDGERRIEAMVRTNDGFELAREDLEIRGQGTVFAASQSGRSDLRLANIVSDLDSLIAARDDAFALVDTDPGLREHPDLLAEIVLFFGDDEEGKTEWLFIS
jgi:ATP-dependent DNA helicase RecG